jgi:peptidoglycan/LPS O-acetylase OafA/YrhL
MATANKTNSAGRRLAFADGLRGIASFWVVLFHMGAGHHITALKMIMPLWVSIAMFDWGYLGVPIFFVLSGFVMAYTVRQIKINGSLGIKFVLRRLIRLSPPYYFAIAFAIGMGFLKAYALGVAQPHVGLSDIVAHLLYLQEMLSKSEINSVFWTLGIEVQFYFAFAILLVISDSSILQSIHSQARIYLIGFVSLLSLLWPAHITQYQLWHADFLGFWHSFLAGVLVCWGWIEGGKVRQFAIVYCATMLLIGIGFPSGFTITAAITGSLLLAAGLMGTMGTWLSWSWIQAIGLISYSLYLLHNPLTGATFSIVGKVLPFGYWTESVGIICSIVICLGASWIAFMLIERPSIAWSHSISFTRKTPN